MPELLWDANRASDIERRRCKKIVHRQEVLVQSGGAVDLGCCDSAGLAVNFRLAQDDVVPKVRVHLRAS